jgi:competence protein ComEA
MSYFKKMGIIIGILAILTICVTPFMVKADQPPAPQGKININTATAEQLTLLPGIGEVTANAIVAYRTANGNFASVEDILNVKGIGEKTLEKIKDFIVLEGETTLKGE